MIAPCAASPTESSARPRTSCQKLARSVAASARAPFAPTRPPVPVATSASE